MKQDFYLHPTYIKMCDRATELKEEFKNLPYENKIGTWVVWRSFAGIIVPVPEQRNSKWSFFTELQVTRWLDPLQDIKVVKMRLYFPDKILQDPDLGTPVFDIGLLQKFIRWSKISEEYLSPLQKVEIVLYTIERDMSNKLYQFEILEQVWLVATMSINYNKIWDFGKEEWIEKSEEPILTKR